MLSDVQMESFGGLIKQWRKKRGLSQLKLATNISTTSRHMSFLETGRSKPSKTMILRLADALDIPFRERNDLLKAAGFSAQYKLRELQHPDMGLMNHAVELLLKNHEPFPGFVLDRYWNLLKLNAPGEAMLQSILPNFDPSSTPNQNLLKLMFIRGGLAERVLNWRDVAKQVIQRIKRESFDDLESAALIEELRHGSDLPQDYWDIELESVISPVIPMTIALENGIQLSMLSTITTFGTPVDIMAQELRIELVLPADPVTEAVFREQFAVG